jgi:hypothetical protein
MRPLRLVPWAGIVVLSTLAGCSKDDPAMNPAPSRHALIGHINLTGYLVDAQGAFTGTRVVRDADGVFVELLSGASVATRVSTVDGVYRFGGLLPGAYQTRSTLIPPVSDMSAVFTIVSSDLMAGDTLNLTSYGDLKPIPNPFSGETTVYFAIPETLDVSLHILSLAGDTVQTLLQGQRPPGINQVRWDGTDRFGATAPVGNYWVTFAAGSDQRAHLLFKQ